MQVTTKKISELKRAEKNVRLHGDRQIKEYIRSVEMFGQIRPLVIDENNVVICGNGLLQAFQQMGKETAECYVVSNLSENQKKKLMLADNKIYELGVNNTAEFDNMLKELAGDIDIPGYDPELLKVLTASANEATEIIDNYGTLPKEQVEQIKTRAEYTPPTIQATPAIQPASAENSVTPPPVQSPQRFITCPKCGEKIWL